MTITIKPLSESHARGMEIIRKKIKQGNFTIVPHALARMKLRDIQERHVLEAIRFGTCSFDRRVDGWLGGLFVLNDLVIAVYAPYGDHETPPSIWTCYRDGDVDWEFKIGTALVKSTDELTDEELEQAWMNRKHEKAEKARAEQERRAAELDARIARVESELQILRAERETI